MELQDIVTTVTCDVNVIRSFRNEGNEAECLKRLRLLKQFLNENVPDEPAENPTEEKEVTP